MLARTLNRYICANAMAVQVGTQDPTRKQAKRFHRDGKSWSQDRIVFVDTGVHIPGQPLFLKTREYLRMNVACGEAVEYV